MAGKKEGKKGKKQGKKRETTAWETVRVCLCMHAHAQPRPLPHTPTPSHTHVHTHAQALKHAATATHKDFGLLLPGHLEVTDENGQQHQVVDEGVTEPDKSLFLYKLVRQKPLNVKHSAAARNDFFANESNKSTAKKAVAEWGWNVRTACMDPLHLSMNP